jgi:hypothetical protein
MDSLCFVNALFIWSFLSCGILYVCTPSFFTCLFVEKLFTLAVKIEVEK